jgi:hypothetical protein
MEGGRDSHDRRTVCRYNGRIFHQRCGSPLTVDESHDTADQREIRLFCWTCLEHVYLSPSSLIGD